MITQDFQSRRFIKVLVTQFLFLAPIVNWRGVNLPTPGFKLSAPSRSRAKSLLAIFTVLSLLVTVYRWPTKVPQPYRPGPRILRAGIWTVHFGIDDEGRDSQRRMRDLVRYVELPFIRGTLDSMFSCLGTCN